MADFVKSEDFKRGMDGFDFGEFVGVKEEILVKVEDV